MRFGSWLFWSFVNTDLEVWYVNNLNVVIGMLMPNCTNVVKIKYVDAGRETLPLNTGLVFKPYWDCHAMKTLFLNVLMSTKSFVENWNWNQKMRKFGLMNSRLRIPVLIERPTPSSVNIGGGDVKELNFFVTKLYCIVG